MSNAYTQMLENKDTTLEDFIIHGFMRQYINPETKLPIPQKIKPSRHNYEALMKARERFAEVWEWDDEEADEEAEKDYRRNMKWYKEQSAKRNVLKKRNEEILDKLQAWKTSTMRMENLKTFLEGCLNNSISGPDCYKIDKPVRQTGKEFKDSCIKKVRHDMEFHGREHQEAIVFARLETKLINEIRASIHESEVITMANKK